MRHEELVTFSAIMLLSICSVLASGMPSADATDHLPSISELETMNLTSVEPTPSPKLPYTEALTVRGLFFAYNAGSDAISKYREPVLTRGTSGITVFKAVSPSVVVVVVGRVKTTNSTLKAWAPERLSIHAAMCSQTGMSSKVTLMPRFS